MKRGIVLFAGVLAAIFLFSSIDDADARKTRRKSNAGDNKILKDMRSNNNRIAVPAINKAPSLSNARSKSLASRILKRIILDRKKHPAIKVAAANMLSVLKDKSAIRILQRQLRVEKNPGVKRAYQNAISVLSGKGGQSGYRGTPSYGGSPRYGSPGYR